MLSKAKQRPQLKFFISCVDTLVGQAIIEQVRNDHLNDVDPHIILGTKSTKNVGPVPNSVKKIINNSDVNVLIKTLLDSDVIIYDLNSAKKDEVEFAIKTLKMANYESEKFLILISSVMVWSNTPQKEKKEGEEEEEEVGEPEEGEEEEQPPANEGGDDEAPPKVYVAYKESDYARRKPTTNYEIFKSLETLCLSAGNSKKNLLTYVLCSGILYGNGEEVFANYFKQAWLQNPQALSYIGDGKNLIPGIHVKDLAMFVNFVINKRPSTRYIFAIDHGRKPTLKNYVETISKGLGTGNTASISVMDAINDPYLEVFKLNIKLRPSKIIEEMEAAEGEEEPEPEDAEEDAEKLPVPKFKFVWWCKDGMRKNIAKIVEEYNTFRGLKPIKMFVTGPPASGKTHYGTLLSKHYNVPHILVADVVKEVKELQNEFGEEVRTALDEIKEKMVEEAEAALEELKKKKKKGQPDPVVEPDKLIPRLPEELLIKAYKLRLQKNDCFNRGYVIDGFPRTYEQAKGVFLTNPPLKEGEEEPADPENVPLVIDERKVPEFVVKFESTDEALKARVKGLPEDQVAGTHYTEEGMTRRLQAYKASNFSESGNPVLSTFFNEHNIEILNLKLETLTDEEVFKAIKIFVERKEKFKNYQDFEEIQEQARKKALKQDQEQEKKRQEAAKKEQEERENEERLLQEEKARLQLERIKEQEKKLLDERSQPLRQYLADMVVPILTSGIIQICKEKPDDPVDYLAEYLFKKSLEVKQPDPGAAGK